MSIINKVYTAQFALDMSHARPSLAYSRKHLSFIFRSHMIDHVMK